MRKTDMLRRTLAGLLCVAGMTMGLAAAAGDTPRLRVENCDGRHVSYEVESRAGWDSVQILAAAYDRQGRMQQCLSEHTSLAGGVHRGEQTFRNAADEVRLYLLDGRTGMPLSAPGQRCRGVFRDWDGTELGSREFYTGQKLPAPYTPSRQDQIFTGWDRSTWEVWEDSTFTAQYVPVDHPNIFRFLPASGTPGQTVTVTLELTGQVKLCGFDFSLIYDPDALEFVSMNSKKDFFITANHLPGHHRIRFNYVLRPEPPHVNREKGGTVMELTFRLREGAETDAMLKLIPQKVALWDPNVVVNHEKNAEYAVTEGVIRVQ